MTTVHSGETLLLTVLVQLALILSAARLGGWLFVRCGQPAVVGEIAAGLALGPSLLGRLAPASSAWVFSPAAAPVLGVLGQLGLVFLMFMIGLEFEFGHLRSLRGAAAAVALAGIVMPFGLGLALGWAIAPQQVPDGSGSPAGLAFFLAVALSITAIPILGRIMLDFHIHRTRLAALIISAAAIDDTLGWVLLAAVTAMVRGRFEPAGVAAMLAVTLLFGFCLVLVVRPLLRGWLERAVTAEGELGVGAFALVLVLVLGSAAVSNAIGVFSVLGPFLLGAALWDCTTLRRAVERRMRDLIYVFFLPIFFTYTGLRTDVGLLEGSREWLLCGLICVAAITGKMVGCGTAALACGLGWRESGCVAVMMNTRALMGLVAINVGYELGVVPDAIFSMLVIMALVTTLMTTPLLRRLMCGTEFERAHRQGSRGAPRPMPGLARRWVAPLGARTFRRRASG